MATPVKANHGLGGMPTGPPASDIIGSLRQSAVSSVYGNSGLVVTAPAWASPPSQTARQKHRGTVISNFGAILEHSRLILIKGLEAQHKTMETRHTMLIEHHALLRSQQKAHDTQIDATIDRIFALIQQVTASPIQPSTIHTNTSDQGPTTVYSNLPYQSPGHTIYTPMSNITTKPPQIPIILRSLQSMPKLDQPYALPIYSHLHSSAQKVAKSTYSPGPILLVAKTTSFPGDITNAIPSILQPSHSTTANKSASASPSE